jgi:hypothetical protein
MIELVLLVCLRLDPAACDKRILPFVNVTQLQCMIGAPSVIAAWSERNPLHTVEEWNCRYPPKERTA